MRTTTLAVLAISALLVVLACRPVAAEDAKTTAADSGISTTRIVPLPKTLSDKDVETESAVIVITSDPSVSDINNTTVIHLLESLYTSAGQGGKDTQHALLRFDAVSFGKGRLVGSLRVASVARDKVNSPELRQFANTASPAEILAVASKQLEAMLVEMTRPDVDRLKRELAAAVDECASAEADVKKTQSELAEVQERLAKLKVSPNDLSERVERLRQQHFALRVELTGLEARHDMLVKHVVTVRGEAEATKKQPDPTLTRLETVLQIREREYSRRREANSKIPGSVSQAEIEIARLNLVAAETDLAELRQKRQHELGGERLQRLNDQLLDVQTELAGAKARLRVVEDELGRLDTKEVADSADRFQDLSFRLMAAKKRLESVSGVVADAEGRFKSYRPPTVRVIGAPAAAK